MRKHRGFLLCLGLAGPEVAPQPFGNALLIVLSFRSQGVA